MGKRSDFERRPQDAYLTFDQRAYPPLLPFLSGVRTFAEPCAGQRHMVRRLEAHGLTCVYQGDIADGRARDALKQTRRSMKDPDVIVSNPPWTRRLLHMLISRFRKIAPTWLLFDADWAFNANAAPFLAHCSHIVAVGRLRWIEGTTKQGKDNCAWYRFDSGVYEAPQFINWRHRKWN